MDKIFTLPIESNNWIETNDALTNLSEINVTKDCCIVPFHIFEDSLADAEIKYTEYQYKYKYPRHMFSQIQLLREQSYHACIWYPEIKDTIPTADSILLSLTSIDQLKKDLETYIL